MNRRGALSFSRSALYVGEVHSGTSLVLWQNALGITNAS